MTARETLEAGIAAARTARDQASAERTRVGLEWRKNTDASASLDLFRANWSKAEAEWERANAALEKLTSDLAAFERAEGRASKRAALEAMLAQARKERDNADAALAAVARARAEREKNAPATPSRAERRAASGDRRKPGRDRRKSVTDRRAATISGSLDTPANEWAEAVKRYNKADAAWNAARAALADFLRADG